MEIFGTFQRVPLTPSKALLMRTNTSWCLTTQILTNSGSCLDLPFVISADYCSRTTFMVDDWLEHTPRDIIAKNFGVDPSVFANLPATDPYIFNGTVSTSTVTASSAGPITGNSSYVYRTLQHDPEKVPGNGGEFRKIDSTNFPISKTLAATFVTLKPGGLRELHWHPNVSSSCPCRVVNPDSTPG
jgi:hypothetical protein